MTQARKSFARQGRGAGNGYNQNWHNSPLWDNMKKSKIVQSVQGNKEFNNNEQKEKLNSQEEQTDQTEQCKQREQPESLKEKQKRMFTMVY